MQCSQCGRVHDHQKFDYPVGSMDNLELLNELEILIDTRQKYCWGEAEKSYPNVMKLINSLRSAQQAIQAERLPDADLFLAFMVRRR